MPYAAPLDSDYFVSPVDASQFVSPVLGEGAAVEVPTGAGTGTVRVLYGHFRLRRPSLTRRDAIAVAMQNRQEGNS